MAEIPTNRNISASVTCHWTILLYYKLTFKFNISQHLFDIHTQEILFNRSFDVLTILKRRENLFSNGFERVSISICTPLEQIFNFSGRYCYEIFSNGREECCCCCYIKFPLNFTVGISPILDPRLQKEKTICNGKALHVVFIFLKYGKTASC